MLDEQLILRLMQECEDEQDIDKRIVILEKINTLLPEFWRLRIPSLITNDYVDTALGKIESILQKYLHHIPKHGMYSSLNGYKHDDSDVIIYSRYLKKEEQGSSRSSIIILCNVMNSEISANYYYQLAELYDFIIRTGHKVQKCNSFLECIQGLSQLVYDGKKVSLILLCGKQDDASIEATARKLKELSCTKIIFLAERSRRAITGPFKNNYIDKTVFMEELNLMDTSALRNELGLEDPLEYGNAASS